MRSHLAYAALSAMIASTPALAMPFSPLSAPFNAERVQFFIMEPGSRFEQFERIHPMDAVAIARSAGLRATERPQLRRNAWVVEGVDRQGLRMQAVVDAFTGDVIRLRHVPPPADATILHPDINQAAVAPLPLPRPADPASPQPMIAVPAAPAAAAPITTGSIPTAPVPTPVVRPAAPAATGVSPSGLSVVPAAPVSAAPAPAPVATPPVAVIQPPMLFTAPAADAPRRPLTPADQPVE